jgi:uncharacterized protein (DUF2147 family)
MAHRAASIVLIAALALASTAAPAAAQSMVEGAWKSGNGSEIVIATCSAGYCGTLTKPAVSAEDLAKYGDAQTAMQSFVDEHNEDKSLRSRPLVGLQLLSVRGTNNPWYFEGEVYNPSDGKTYGGAITVVGADAMMLKGCAVFVFCKEEQLTRVLK